MEIRTYLCGQFLATSRPRRRGKSRPSLQLRDPGLGLLQDGKTNARIRWRLIAGQYIRMLTFKDDPESSTYSALSLIRGAVNNIPANHILFLLDSCFSGLFEPLGAAGGRGGDPYTKLPPPMAYRWMHRFCERWRGDLPGWRLAILVGQARRLALNPPSSAWGRSMLAKRGGLAVQRKYRREGRHNPYRSHRPLTAPLS